MVRRKPFTRGKDDKFITAITSNHPVILISHTFKNSYNILKNTVRKAVPVVLIKSLKAVNINNYNRINVIFLYDFMQLLGNSLTVQNIKNLIKFSLIAELVFRFYKIITGKHKLAVYRTGSH